VAWVVGNQGCDSQHGLVRKRDTNARHIQIYCRPHIFWTNPIQVRKLGHDAKMANSLWKQVQANAVLLYQTLARAHTLAQNCHCEFFCGMHLTCKNNPVAADRSDLPTCRKLPSPQPVKVQNRCWKCADCENRTGKQVTSDWSKTIEVGWTWGLKMVAKAARWFLG